jgi:ABC-type dipeptide/oligopeptide/nickel transport system ATPase component
MTEIEESTLWQEGVGATATGTEVERLQRLAGGPQGYRLRRVILVNFWLYEIQEFEIPHGRLFLAGENASGKSTVLMAAIPLVLDGNHRPERIDTFGKREKRIDYYILGSNESATPFIREQRSSYVALEFEWCDMETPPFASELRTRWERGEYERARYLTIGLAFAGNRNSVNPVHTSRFLITDGSRLVTDQRARENSISLVQKVTGGGTRAIDARTFRKTIAEHGLVYDSANEYEQKVAQMLFNFSNIQDFRRLIRQLLYLRQPNLNSVLSLEAVRAYLDQSLPQIPLDMIQHAATTLEMMDSLREEIERRRKAYSATEKLHHAQEALTLARVRNAARDYLHKQFQEDREQNNVRRLRSNLTRAANECDRSQVRLDSLEQEEARVMGELQALQGSEGMQAAQRLNEVSSRVARLESELRTQQAILADASDNREQHFDNVKRQSNDFGRWHQENIQHLQEMEQDAENRAYWELAAEQLAEAQQQMQLFTLEAGTPTVNTQISTLLDTQIAERLQWLRRLGLLHRTIERESQNVQAAQQRESRYYEEVDEATRSFEEQREETGIAWQTLAEMLDEVVEENDEISFDHFSSLQERGARLSNEALAPQEFVSQMQTLVRDYLAAIDNAGRLLSRSVDLSQKSLGELQEQQGRIKDRAREAEERYRKKLEEPEYVPPRTEQRDRARERLAQQSIPALPLYMLIDFASDIDSESGAAGQIEHLLQDAGLLDALVIPPAHTAEADAFLRAEGLSDCRLDIERLLGMAPIDGSSLQLLQMDPAMFEIFGECAGGWEATINPILAAMQRTVFANFFREEEQQGTWKHGLITGQAGEGIARSIGKATRIRAQQRAQEELRQDWEALENELQQIVIQVEATTQRLQALNEQQKQLDGALKKSAIETADLALQLAVETLEKVRRRYQEAREETQEIRQRIISARTRLQHESGPSAIFASNAASVEQAQDATNQLRSSYQALHNRIGNMLRAWREYKQASETLERARTAEMRAAEAHTRKERETETARAQLNKLKELISEMDGGDANALLANLQALQERAAALPEEKQKEHDAVVRLEENIKNTRTELEGALESFERAQQWRSEGYNSFVALLKSYPIERLALALNDLAQRSAQEVAQDFLDEPLTADEDVHHTRKLALDSEERVAYEALYATYSEVSNLLHDYGPRLVAGGTIVFVNADQANPFELLTRLGEEIQQQERLLDDKERELFKDFLLKEMADTIRKHILEAEGWIERINGVLARTAIIEEHYHLDWATREYERDQAGSYLAQHHKLLRRQAQTLKEEEVEALVHAFRQEVASVRASSQENRGTSFVESLANIFDYRQWFRFEITLILPDKSRLHLTDRLLKKRSGAEQYVALYVPFFAALSALYESAGQGAPRLIALDEAFDKVSVKNTKLMLKFLASQQFQWIMTGPRLTGEGTELPACVRYLMLHEKGTELATGFPSFWSDAQMGQHEQNGQII